MQISHPLHAGVRQASASADIGVARMLESKARARRWWAIRSTILLAASAVGLCVFVTWRRDCLTIQALLQNVRQPVAVLQSRVDELGALPAVLPADLSRVFPSYADSADRFFAAKSGGPAIVAAGPIVRLILRKDGRYIVVYDHGKLSSEWASMPQFDARIRDQIERTRLFEQERQSRPPELP